MLKCDCLLCLTVGRMFMLCASLFVSPSIYEHRALTMHMRTYTPLPALVLIVYSESPTKKSPVDSLDFADTNRTSYQPAATAARAASLCARGRCRTCVHSVVPRRSRGEGQQPFRRRVVVEEASPPFGMVREPGHPCRVVSNALCEVLTLHLALPACVDA